MDEQTTERLPTTAGAGQADTGQQRELHALLDLTTALGASTDLDISLRVLLERMLSTFGADGGECRLLASGNAPAVLVQHGLGSGLAAAALRRGAAQDLIEYAFRRREPVGLSDFSGSAHRARRELTHDTGLQALLCVPLFDDQQQPLGTLVLYYRIARDVAQGERRLLTAIAQQLAINIARARRYEAERAHAEQLQRSRWLTASLSRAAAALQSVHDTDGLIHALARQLLRLRLHSALLMPAAQPRTWHVRHISLLPSTLALIQRQLGVDLPNAQFHEDDVPRLMPLLERGTPLLVRDLPQVAPHWVRRPGRTRLEHLLTLAGLMSQSALMALPLKVDNHIEGLLLVWGTNLSSDSVPTFSIFGHQVAASLRAVRLREQVSAASEKLRRLTQQVMDVQEEERARISRELHDESGQALTALKIELTLLSNELPDIDPRLHARMKSAIAQVDELLGAIRRMAHEMHPPVLETLGLNATLEGYCESFNRRTRISVNYSGEPLPDLSPHMAIALYRFVQEALTNVARHADATRVDVALRQRDHQLELVVQDDGCGFDTLRLANSLGLVGMRERIEALAGKLEIESEIDVGTQLTALVPLPASEGK